MVDLETPVRVCKTPESHLKQPVLCSFSRHHSGHGGLQWKVDLAEDSYSWLCLIWFPVTLHDSIRTVSPGCEPCLSSHSSACFHIALAAQLCLFV